MATKIVIHFQWIDHSLSIFFDWSMSTLLTGTHFTIVHFFILGKQYQPSYYMAFISRKLIPVLILRRNQFLNLDKVLDINYKVVRSGIKSQS